MRALVLDAKNAPFRLEERPIPRVEPSTVLLRVRACGVCHRDLIDRRGLYPFSMFPRIIGHEIAGEIMEVGPEVTGFQPGDRVATTHRPACGQCWACLANEPVRCERGVWSYGMTVDGGYTEACIAHAGTLVKIPDAIDFEHACFLHCTAAVALRALLDRGKLAGGETVLVTGASGGVGMHALQLIRHIKARAIAVTSNESKVAELKGAGASEVIVANERTRVPDEVAKLTDGRGADMALELVGKPTWNDSVRSLRPGGRVVLVGNVTAERVEMNPGFFILRELQLIGSASASRGNLESVFELVAKGVLKPILAGTLPLEDAEKAHERLRSRDVVGRLVLVP